MYFDVWNVRPPCFKRVLTVLRVVLLQIVRPRWHLKQSVVGFPKRSPGFLTQRALWCLKGCKHDIPGLCPAQGLPTCTPPPLLTLLSLSLCNVPCLATPLTITRKKKKKLKCHTHPEKNLKIQWGPTKNRLGIDCRMCSLCLKNPPTISTTNCTSNDRNPGLRDGAFIDKKPWNKHSARAAVKSETMPQHKTLVDTWSLREHLEVGLHHGVHSSKTSQLHTVKCSFSLFMFLIEETALMLEDSICSLTYTTFPPSLSPWHIRLCWCHFLIRCFDEGFISCN